MQTLWQLRLHWDEPLPEIYVNNWINFKSSLQYINQLQLPRKIVEFKDVTSIQVHGFADASTKAYGAYIYIRSISNTGECNIRLLCAKSRVAPLKVISLPRLELCAVLLLARLASKFIPTLNINVEKRYYWTDSSIALSWISSPSAKWSTFVAHRVGEVQDLTNISEWGHVMTTSNPADIISRGCTPQELCDDHLWWNGPEWLKLDSSSWPVFDRTRFAATDIPEQRQTSIAAPAITHNDNNCIINQFSSLSKLLRVQQFSQNLWKRWHREYLHQLQERKKWAGEKGPKLELGTVVLIREDNIPPLKWKIGRVIKLDHGNDGVVCVATVKTRDIELTRSVRNLCPLPFDGNY